MFPTNTIPNNINTLQTLFDWCRANRKSAWFFPTKWEVQGYWGSLPLCIVGDVPGERSLEHVRRTPPLPYANDVDVFTTKADDWLYALLKAHGMADVHIMDARTSVVPNAAQDTLVFLRTMHIVKPDALIIMGGSMSKTYRTVERYFKGWAGTKPKMYTMYHYSPLVRASRLEQEQVFVATLRAIVSDYPNLASFVRP
jgi:hypothetical protein